MVWVLYAVKALATGDVFCGTCLHLKIPLGITQIIETYPSTFYHSATFGSSVCTVLPKTL